MSVTSTIEDSARCPWCTGFDLYREYHDKEWGSPVRDDRKQFEFLVLESAQAGLSWSTILKKREGYRKAFEGFDYEKVASFSPTQIESLIQNPEIVRNRMKIEAAVNNAGKFLDVIEKHGSFSSFIWDFVDGVQIQNHFKNMGEVPAKTAISDKLAKEMKRLGFKFLGSTILYAHMQATGLVNDHLVTCFRHKELMH